MPTDNMLEVVDPHERNSDSYRRGTAQMEAWRASRHEREYERRIERKRRDAEAVRAAAKKYSEKANAPYEWALANAARVREMVAGMRTGESESEGSCAQPRGEIRREGKGA